MSKKFSYIVSLLLVTIYVIDLIETMKLFPLSNDVCKEVLSHANVDVSDVKIIRYELDAKSTLHTGQSPNREIFRLFVDYEKDSQIQNATFLIKAPINSLIYNLMYSLGVYEKEYALYSQVFPEMTKLEGESFSAKFIAGDDMKYINTLILEDVYSLGYKKENSLKPLTLDQCKLVFEKLAKFHALSVILDKRGLIPDIVKTPPEPENDYQEEDQNEFYDKGQAYIKKGMTQFVQNLNSEIKEKYADKLNQMKHHNVCEKVRQGEEGSLQVLVHGNLMALNSLLFKYKEDDDDFVEDVKFFDFLAAKWNSPLVDIFYLAISSMAFEDVEQHFDTLLEIYSKAANDLFKKYDIDQYTLEDMKNDMRKQHMTFMWICGIILPLISNTHLPMQVDGYSFKEPLSAENMMTAYSNEQYVEKASKWFMFFVKRGIFNDN